MMPNTSVKPGRHQEQHDAELHAVQSLLEDEKRLHRPDLA